MYLDYLWLVWCDWAKWSDSVLNYCRWKLEIIKKLIIQLYNWSQIAETKYWKMSVSYTHLDVYKRQVEGGGDNIFYMCTTLLARKKYFFVKIPSLAVWLKMILNINFRIWKSCTVLHTDILFSVWKIKVIVRRTITFNYSNVIKHCIQCL